MSQRLLSTAILLALPLMPGQANARTWTDNTGEHKIEARFVTFQFEKAWLLRADGQTFGASLSELSLEDQEYIKDLLTKKAAEPPRLTNNPADRIPYAPGRQVALLENETIAESSGLAHSRQNPNVFWTHNDSGGTAEFFALDREGRDRGTWRITDTMAFDWEEVVAFQIDGKPHLMLCDVGNNGRNSAVQMLHVVEEPTVSDTPEPLPVEVSLVRTVYYGYEDDYRDCEAVAIDPADNTIVLISKERQAPSYVYTVSWPKDDRKIVLPAKKVASLNHANVTAMDLSPDGRRAIVLTYGDAFEYVRSPAESWADAFSRPPRVIVTPERIQGESICYGPDGRTLYLTSEKRPTPLLEIPVIRPKGAGVER